jgi:glycosyltransferase involved in cell wall biosynthesis
MKKLTIVYHYFAHYREPVLRELCQHLSADFQVELMADEEAEVPALKTIPMSRFTVGLCEYRRLKNLWLGPWLWQIGLLSGIIKGKSDVIIFLGQFNFVSTWFAVLLARLMGKKTYFWSHGVYGNEGQLKRFIRVSFYKLADGMLLYGNYARRLLVDAGLNPRRLHVINNSLDYNRQKCFRDQKEESSVSEIRRELFGLDSPYIIFVGRLTAVKRLDLLLSALSEINHNLRRDVRCLIVGDGPEVDNLELQAKAEGVEGLVKFYGECHDEETLSDLIYAADACVAPGNVGLTAMHSLAYGTPVITHDDKSWQMPEFEAIVPGVSGDFFIKGSLRDLADKICEWLDCAVTGRGEVRVDCCEIIDQKYNPAYQAKVISSVIKGEEASFL